MIEQLHCYGRHSYFYKRKKQAQYKISIIVLKKTGTTTARSTAGGTQGYLYLERDPLIHMTEECSMENSKLQ